LLPAPLEREWLWAALQTLIDARGEQPFLTAPLVLPTDEFFPDPWTPDERGVGAIAQRLLARAGLEHLKVVVELFTEATEVREVGRDGRPAATSHAGAAAWFAGIRDGLCLFGAETDKLTDPLGLVGAMAHEVGHAFRRAHHIERKERDLEEKLTDVTTIYLGFGVLTTATAARFITKHHDDMGSSYAHKQQGYLAANEMAFMLASQLAVRGYDKSASKTIRKHVGANQAAVIDKTLEIDRAVIANGLGFDALPNIPPPAKKPWWRLFG
jgi:hypothetical protein